jgi:hypothetical protein
MLSATTTDSKSITVDYRVNRPPDPASRIQFGVYRSSNAQFDPSDPAVDTVALMLPGASPGQAAATLDQNGVPAAAVGTHRLTIPLPQGLPPYPEKPYVLVVADPDAPSATTDPGQIASFRIYTIGVVTHGGIEDPSWKHGPPWELQIAYEMRHEGYDAVIAYNWVRQSSTPGAAIRQAPKLAKLILATAKKFPASAPVDLDFIGHSEGTVVNTYAIVLLQKATSSQLNAGFITDTLLDPHAANNYVPGKQYSTTGPLGWLADILVSKFQGKANDPPAFVPSIVDEAQVFYQHSPVPPGAIYNLWGQVPVKSDGPVVHYYNLTPMGITHSGKSGVALWYRNFIVPTLGYQAPLVQQLELNGHLDNAQSHTTALGALRGKAARGASRLQTIETHADQFHGSEKLVLSDQPEFSGTAAPGSVVRLYVGPAAEPEAITFAGSTMANDSGLWSLSPRRPLRDGQYRAVVAAFCRSLRTRPGLAIVPTQPLGRFRVAVLPRPKLT